MPMIVNEKQRIFFALEGERGPFVLLHHGLFGSHRDWYDWGYVEALKPNYRLILPDARGHGRSEKPLEPARYNLEALASDLIAVMNELDVRNVNFLGHSLGALVGLSLAKRFSGRVRSAVLGGGAPMVTEELVETWRALAARLERESPTAVVEELRGRHALAAGKSPLPEEAEESGYPHAMLKAMGGWAVNSAERISVAATVALFAGEGDAGAAEANRVLAKISRATLFTLPGTSTVEAVADSSQLLKEVLEFWRESRGGREGGSRGSGRSHGRQSKDPRSEGHNQGNEKTAESTPEARQPDLRKDAESGEPTGHDPAPEQAAGENRENPTDGMAEPMPATGQVGETKDPETGQKEDRNTEKE